MLFTKHQYEVAIQHLQDGMKQLKADGNPCSICSDSGHMAYECGFNPLLAIFLCTEISKHSKSLHETLHYLSGHDFAFGTQMGPAKLIMPPESDPDSIYNRHGIEFIS